MAFDFGALDKAQQKTRLTMEFGMLLRPLKDLAEEETPPGRAAYLRALAFVDGGPDDWWFHVEDFAQGMASVGEHLGHIFYEAFFRFRIALTTPNVDLAWLHGEFRKGVADVESHFLALIDMVPMDWELTLSEGQAPFTFYMHVLDAVSSVRQRLHIFDQYLKPSVFDLYLRNVDRDIEVRLVTVEGDKKHGVLGVYAVSDLARQEFRNYQLLQVNKDDIHDRNLRVDDQVFTLGASAADAGKKPTHFGSVAPSANRVLDDLLAKGTVIHQS